MRILNLLIIVVLLFSFSTVFNVSVKADQDNTKIVNAKDLSFEELYKVIPSRGKNARQIEFSPGDRYLSFLWNPFEEVSNSFYSSSRNRSGLDLYIYDLNNKSLKRVTSIEIMKQFDTPDDYEKFIKKQKQQEEEDKKLQEQFFAQRDYLNNKDIDLEKFEKEEIEKLKKELEEEKKKAEEEKKKDADIDKETGKDKEKDKDKVDKKDDKKDEKSEKEKELWELRDKLKEKKEKEKIKRDDLYPGVSHYQWSKTSDELIFQYNGDLYRYFPAKNKTVRLTMTDENENIISYTHDNTGYYYAKFQKESYLVYRVNFNSSYVWQINHQLLPDNKYKVIGTSISPNDSWMLIRAAKLDGKPAFRDIKIMDYSKRFAEPITEKRDVADDKRNEPWFRFLLRKINNTNYGKEPDYIFEIPGGDVWYEFSEIEWSKDGSQYAFMTWEREKGDLKIWTGKTAAGKKPEMLFSMKELIGYKSSYEDNVKFTPDGKYLLAIINNEDGFRQPVKFNLKTKEKKDIIKGNFESYPIFGFTKDSKYFYVESDIEHPAMHNIYKVSIETGKMIKIGKSGVMHRNPVISHNCRWLASNFGNWEQRPELYLLDTNSGNEKALTKSHDPNWSQYNFIKPELFKFKNRHGDFIYGMIFKPEGWKPEDKRPGIVHLYGGPLGTRHTVEVDNFSGLSHMFQMVMAAKYGYVTINIDTRGQSGFGRKFSEGNWEHPGDSQVEDLEDLVKYIETGYGVDTSRLGLHGWSFGGYQTLKTMFSSPDTFACGIAVASVTEWENYNAWYAGSTIGTSVRGKPTLRKYSLLPLAKNLKNPLLLVHGMMDPNVLFQDTLNVYKALLDAGKETLVDLFLDPEGDHGLGGLIQNKAVFKKFASFFLLHLGKVNP